jgi:hypothetical protein
MTNPHYTAVCLLIDRSGSMTVIQTAAQDAINEFVFGQASAARQHGDKRTIRIATFDSTLELVHTSKPAAECPKFILEPRATTALLDAMGRTIVDFGRELAAMPADERPSTVIVAIMTDGLENASREYDYPQVAAMVRHQETHYGWQFLYLGANQDAIRTGQDLGIDRDHAMTYRASSAGTHSTVESLSTYVASAAAGADPVFSDEDRQNATQ